MRRHHEQLRVNRVLSLVLLILLLAPRHAIDGVVHWEPMVVWHVLSEVVQRRAQYRVEWLVCNVESRDLILDYFVPLDPVDEPCDAGGIPLDPVRVELIMEECG